MYHNVAQMLQLHGFTAVMKDMKDKQAFMCMCSTMGSLELGPRPRTSLCALTRGAPACGCHPQTAPLTPAKRTTVLHTATPPASRCAPTHPCLALACCRTSTVRGAFSRGPRAVLAEARFKSVSGSQTWTTLDAACPVLDAVPPALNSSMESSAQLLSGGVSSLGGFLGSRPRTDLTRPAATRLCACRGLMRHSQSRTRGA